MLVDFIIAELMIWAVMIALLPIVVASISALTRRMSLPRPRPARKRRRTIRVRSGVHADAVSVVVSQHRRPTSAATLRP